MILTVCARKQQFVMQEGEISLCQIAACVISISLSALSGLNTETPFLSLTFNHVSSSPKRAGTICILNVTGWSLLRAFIGPAVEKQLVTHLLGL